MFYTQQIDRQQLNISQMLPRRWRHGHPYSWELRKQAYNAACWGNWWISSSVHISFTRLELKQQTTMDIWMQQVSRRGEPKAYYLIPQPVIVLDNSPYHCLHADRPLSTCTVNIGIWLCRKGIVSDRTMSKNDLQLILPQRPK